ncbi:MAG: GTPase domain-containing protein [Oligoflexales bacterium]|nr:GTPase domain-containing protein [Oligoflexales bacterium]
MALTNFESKDIHCKLVYLGAKSSGKSENLRAIYRRISADEDPSLHHYEDSATSTNYFDFLPVSLGKWKDFHVKLHLFSIPLEKNIGYTSVKRAVMHGIDGFIYVADSRIEKLEESLDGLKSVLKILRDEGHNPLELPKAIQYNKRDLAGLVPTDLLSKELNPSAWPDQEAIASQSVGTTETLILVTKQILKKLAQS